MRRNRTCQRLLQRGQAMPQQHWARTSLVCQQYHRGRSGFCLCVCKTCDGQLAVNFVCCCFCCPLFCPFERSHVQIASCGMHIKRHAKMSLRLANAFNPPAETAPQSLVSPPDFAKLLEQDGNYSPEHALVPAETG